MEDDERHTLCICPLCSADKFLDFLHSISISLILKIPVSQLMTCVVFFSLRYVSFFGGYPPRVVFFAFAEPEPIAFKPEPAAAQAPQEPALQAKAEAPTDESEEERNVPKLKLGGRPGGGDADELSLDSSPRGRFEGEDPNVVDGEDLDLPPFLRKKK